MIEHVTPTHGLANATFEIFIMLLVAFILGWLLHHFMHCRKSTQSEDESVSPIATTAPQAVATPPVANTTITPLISPVSNQNKIDDLKIVEGIGPKIESLLHADGILTMRQLATAEISRVQKILDDAGPRYRMHNPKTWSTQAELIADEKWDE